ncbi:MAG: hypothetical protein K2I93_03145 [Oscillospiraceae bacterium]|nr:hypothetical protein [Oscillospiraceae bacterium]
MDENGSLELLMYSSSLEPIAVIEANDVNLPLLYTTVYDAVLHVSL